jgi:hypothetical protein
MTPARIVESLAQSGVTLTLTPEHGVRATPASRLNDELRGLIRQNLPGIKDWLRAANDPSANSACGCWPDDPGLDAAMNAAEVEAFTARVLLFMRRGLNVPQAEALAGSLTRRDREGDDRRVCMECRYLSTARNCAQWLAAGLGSQAVGGLLAKPQRCTAFRESR